MFMTRLECVQETNSEMGDQQIPLGQITYVRKIKVRQLKHVFTADCMASHPYFPHHFLSLH